MKGPSKTLLSSFVFGDQTVYYILNHPFSTVGITLLPSALQDLFTLDGAWMADGLVQVKLVGDGYAPAYSQGLVVFRESDARDYVEFMLSKAESEPLYLKGSLSAELRLFDDEKGYDGLIAYHVRQIRPCSVVRLSWSGPDRFRLPFFSLTGAKRTAVYEWVDE